MTEDAAARPLEPQDAIYLSDLAHDHAGQVAAGSETIEYALRTVAVCAYEYGQEPRRESLRAFVYSRAFFDLMHTYRHAPVLKPQAVVDAFEAVRAALLAEAAPKVERKPDQHLGAVHE